MHGDDSSWVLRVLVDNPADDLMLLVATGLEGWMLDTATDASRPQRSREEADGPGDGDASDEPEKA